MNYRFLKASLLMLISAVAVQSPAAFAYTLDQANRVLTIAPGSTSAATTTDFRNALNYLTNRSDKSSRWSFKFKPGTYLLTSQTPTSGLQNVDFVSDPANPAIIRKASNWSSSSGEFIMFNKFSRSISMTGFTIYGQTSFASSKAPVWPDQGIYFGSSNGVTVHNNKFFNFGNAALRVATYEGDPVKGVNSFNTRVTNNQFTNVFQISTTSNDYIHGATANYVFENNTISNLIGSVKFATRTAGAKNVKVLNNTINGGDHYGFEIDNYNDFEISGNTIKNVKSVAINIYTNARAQQSFPWGDNYTIARNNFENVGRGIRFSPDPYQDGYKPRPKNLVIDNNTMNGVTDGSNPAVSIINGIVDGVKITNNKFNRIASKKYISVSAGSTSVVQLGNFVDGLAYGPQPSGGGTTPAAPSELAGSFTDGMIKLNWKDNASNETAQEIAYSKDGSAYTKLVDLGANVTTYTYKIDTTATGTRYYKIRALNTSGASAPSATASVSLVASNPTPTPTATKPLAPTNVVGQVQSKTSVKLSWTDNANNETSQQIWVSKDGGQYDLLAKLGANITSYTHTITTDPGSSTLYYTVRAVNAYGASSFPPAYKAVLTSAPTVATMP